MTQTATRTDQQSDKAEQKVRLDKWLWAARFFKTRTLAKEAIEGGKVHYNQQRCKPGRTVEPGAELTLRQGWQETTVIVDAVSDKRRGAPEARTLYHETEESAEKRAERNWEFKTMQAAQLPPARRPTKKERRSLDRFREQHSFQ